MEEGLANFRSCSKSCLLWWYSPLLISVVRLVSPEGSLARTSAKLLYNICVESFSHPNGWIVFQASTLGQLSATYLWVV